MTDGTEDSTDSVLSNSDQYSVGVGGAGARAWSVGWSVGGSRLFFPDGTPAGTLDVAPFIFRLGFTTPPIGLFTSYAAAVSPFYDREIDGGFWIADAEALTVYKVELPGDPSFRFRPSGFADGANFARFGGSESLMLEAYTDLHGAEVGTWAGPGQQPQRRTDLYAGPDISEPRFIAELGGQRVDRLDEPGLGREPYALVLLELGVFGAEPFGFGCSSGLAPRLDASGGGAPEDTLQLEVERVGPGSVTLAFFDIGVVVLPQGSGCTLYLAAPKLPAVAQADAEGDATIPITIPDDPRLIGPGIAVQIASAEAGGAVPRAIRPERGPRADVRLLARGPLARGCVSRTARCSCVFAFARLAAVGAETSLPRPPSAPSQSMRHSTFHLNLGRCSGAFPSGRRTCGLNFGRSHVNSQRPPP